LRVKAKAGHPHPAFAFFVLWFHSYFFPSYFCQMNTLKDLMERSAFGVCSYLGEKMGLASSRVRMYFIYLSFVALGSPVLLYLFLAFWLNIKRYIRSKRNLLWE